MKFKIKPFTWKALKLIDVTLTVTSQIHGVTKLSLPNFLLKIDMCIGKVWGRSDGKMLELVGSNYLQN